MKRIALAGAALLLFAGSASAQVAVPELTPAAPRYFFSDGLGITSATVTPDNPAALQWGMPSRAAFGVFKLHEVDPTTPGSEQDASGRFLGLRGVGERWAGGIETISADRSPITFKESATSGQLSFQILQGLALGVGLDRGKTDNGTATSTLKGTTYGLSVNVQKVFYLGYAMGSEDLDSGGATASRDTTMVGVGVRTEGSVRWHLAWDEVQKDDFVGGITGKGFDMTTLTVQAGLGNLLLGGQRVKVAPKVGGGNTKVTVVDVGWAPDKGLTLTARLSRAETEGAGVVVNKADLRAVNLAYLW